MPGIYGFVKSTVLARSNIRQVADEMKLYDHFIQDPLFEGDYIAAGRVHLGKIGEKSSPASLRGLKIWLEGDAYNQKNVAESLGLERTGLADLLLEAYATEKLEACLNQLDGYFCAALYDESKQQVK